ncbi:MAG TPA: SMC-Scp complex subunit ScpB [Lysobacter sp.]|nr:SMC-Scp complex subunit ScpB [Lysobacter sp.]
MDQTLITRIVEAALLAANQPLTLAQLNELFTADDEQAPAASVAQALETLQADCAGRGVELVELASGFRYQVKADVHPWVARLWTERQTRYTRATLETLALIAYRQPITRGEIEQVRGVAVSSNIIRALEEREWIRVVGHRDVPGKPALFGTTKGFLDYFGLKRLDELPPLSELKEIGELEPQLQFNGEDAAKPPRTIDAGGIATDAGTDDGQHHQDTHTDADADTRDGTTDPTPAPVDDSHGNDDTDADIAPTHDAIDADDSIPAHPAIETMEDSGPLEEDDAALASSEQQK